MVLSGSALIAEQVLVARYAGAVHTETLFTPESTGPEEPRSTLAGPFDVLLVGIDPRPEEPDAPPHADSVIVLHVSRSLDGYLLSLPRDLLVDVPAYPRAHFPGADQIKLTEAMFYGSQLPGVAKPDLPSGFDLLARTVSRVTGIDQFAAGAVVNFEGFQKVVEAMGGVDMDVDERVVSIHVTPDGRSRYPTYERAVATRPQKVYEPGPRHFQAWEALDYVRQRHIEGDDYARQRHQQQFLRAMVKQALSAGVVTNPLTLDRVLRAAGQSLTFDGRGRSIVDFALALRHLSADAVTMLKTPGGAVTTAGGQYRGEGLKPAADGLFEALRSDTLDRFAADHPDLVNH
jgi:polyisoprenyl-teichoic acid--peptidoglycan teichoic acid transferase